MKHCISISIPITTYIFSSLKWFDFSPSQLQIWVGERRGIWTGRVGCYQSSPNQLPSRNCPPDAGPTSGQYENFKENQCLRCAHYPQRQQSYRRGWSGCPLSNPWRHRYWCDGRRIWVAASSSYFTWIYRQYSSHPILGWGRAIQSRRLATLPSAFSPRIHLALPPNPQRNGGETF